VLVAGPGSRSCCLQCGRPVEVLAVVIKDDIERHASDSRGDVRRVTPHRLPAGAHQLLHHEQNSLVHRKLDQDRNRRRGGAREEAWTFDEFIDIALNAKRPA
jgi:hypothetical protein